MDGQMLWTATSSLATVALLIVTAAYAWATFQMLNTAKHQMWEASRPRMLIAARTNQGGQFLLIHVENVGVSSAHNLRLEISCPVHQNFGANDSLNDKPLFAQGLRSFPPRTPVCFGLGVAFTYLNDSTDRDLHPSSFDIVARYQHDGRSIQEKFPIDINEQYSYSLVERDSGEDFAKKFPDLFTRAARELNRSIIDAARPDPVDRPRGKSWNPWFRGVRRTNRW
jgi:hypothetical protein